MMVRRAGRTIGGLSWWRPRLVGVMAFVIAVAVAGCAGRVEQPETPSSVKGVAGQWEGLISFPGRFDQPIYVSIAPDGALTVVWGSNQAWGRVTVVRGRASFDMSPPPYEGDLKLYQSDGETSLVMQELWGSFTANLSRQKP